MEHNKTGSQLSAAAGNNRQRLQESRQKSDERGTEGGKIPPFSSAYSTLLTQDRNVFMVRMLSTSGRTESCWAHHSMALYGYSYSLLRMQLGANVQAEAEFIPGIPAQHKGKREGLE